MSAISTCQIVLKTNFIKATVNNEFFLQAKEELLNNFTEKKYEGY